MLTFVSRYILLFTLSIARFWRNTHSGVTTGHCVLSSQHVTCDTWIKRTFKYVRSILFFDHRIDAPPGELQIGCFSSFGYKITVNVDILRPGSLFLSVQSPHS